MTRVPRLAQRASSGSVDRSKVTSLIVDALAQALARVLQFEGPADAVMSRFFREHSALGSRDRSMVAEAIFHALRHYATLGWVLQPAQPARAPRLAALVTLARQHGREALDERALRGDAARSSMRSRSIFPRHRPRCEPNCRTGCSARSSSSIPMPRR
jgi:hypothetical protein